MTSYIIAIQKIEFYSNLSKVAKFKPVYVFIFQKSTIIHNIAE